MDFGIGTLTTINPNAIGAFDLDSAWRIPLWDDREEEQKMQQIENDSLLLTLMNRLVTVEQEWDQPIMQYRIDNRKEFYTTFALAASAADLALGTFYISLAVPYIVSPGWILHIPDSGMELVVEDTDPDLSEAWANEAAGACNVKVTWQVGPRSAVASGTYCKPGGPYLGERGTAKRGVTTTPGDPIFNFMSMYAIYFDMSTMQLEANMATPYGTWDKEMQNVIWQMNHGIQNDLVFGHKDARNDTTNEGMIYRSAGLIEQFGDNFIDFGAKGNGMTWGNMVDYWDPMFESRLSSPSKVHVAGTQHYTDVLGVARQEGRLVAEPEFDMDLGVNSYTVKTGKGRTITIVEEKWVFAGGQEDWGITLDMGNIKAGRYKNMGNLMFPDIQARNQITTKAHANLQTIALNVIDPSTMGTAKGGTRSRIATR